MKQLKKNVLILIIAAGLVAQPNFYEGKMEHNEAGMNKHKMMSELKLTDEQQKKMDELHLKFQKTAIDQKAAIQKKEIDKRQAMQNEEFILAKKLTTELFDLKEEIVKQQITQHEEMLKILTPEQKQKFKESGRDGFNKMSKGKHGRGFKKGCTKISGKDKCE